MNESAQRILAWVKQHPYISAAILLGVVVLGYLAYKRGAFSGSKSESNVSAEDNSGQPPESGIGTSPIPDSSSFTSPATSSGGVTTSSSDTGSDSYGVSQDTWKNGYVPLPLPDFQPTPTLSELANINSNAASQLGNASGGVKPKSAGGLGKASGSGKNTGVVAPASNLGSAGGGSKSASALGKAKSGIKPKTGGNTAPSTLYGKGPHYTGYINVAGTQVYFVNGYPSYGTMTTQSQNAMFGSPDR